MGFLITIIIAISGFRTFGRWRREKLEEKRIEVAFEALAVAYESNYIFGHIRSPMSYSSEWADMPPVPGESESERQRRGSFYATLKRIDDNKDYFDRAWRLQPRCMAMFGPEAEDIFLQLHQARRMVETSAGMLTWDRDQLGKDKEDFEFRQQLKADVWAEFGQLTKEGDRVGKKLEDFRARMEALCRPVIDREYSSFSIKASVRPSP
jgi:hypothetical protein